MTLSNVANHVADWASRVYPVLKAQHPALAEEDIFLMMLKHDVKLRLLCNLVLGHAFLCGRLEIPPPEIVSS